MLSTCLFVFDFDHTILDCNSDTIIYGLLPGGNLPEEVGKLYDNDWNRFMQIVFDHMHSLNIPPESVSALMADAPLTEGFLDLLKFLRSNKVHSIIASDSNTYFIDTILNKREILNVFDGVYTNPAKYQGSRLMIQPYELGHGCKSCRPNMCKTKIIRDHMKRQEEKGIKYDKVVFLGDGGNDYCPIDAGVVNVAFVRLGFALEKLLKKTMEPKSELFYWNNGGDVLSVINQWA